MDVGRFFIALHIFCGNCGRQLHDTFGRLKIPSLSAPLQKLLLSLTFALFANTASAMFIQPDWLDPTEPGVGTNRYAYSGNDPINKLDPGGNASVWSDEDGDGLLETERYYEPDSEIGRDLANGNHDSYYADKHSGFQSQNSAGDGVYYSVSAKDPRWLNYAIRSCKGKCARALDRVTSPLDHFFKNTVRNAPRNFEIWAFPGRASARATHDKTVRYLLNPNVKAAVGKEKFFREYLGFTQENARVLSNQIVFNGKDAVATTMTQYGQRYNQVISIKGANGRMMDVSFTFQNDIGTKVYRMITSTITP